MKKFSEVYDLVFRHKGELEGLLSDYKAARNRKTIWFIIIFLMIIAIIFLISGGNISNIFSSPFTIFIFIICCFIFWGIYSYSVGKDFAVYRNRYKDLVIKEIIKTVDENLEYLPDQGLSLSEYHRGFHDRGESMSSEDMIKGNILNNISTVMSQVRVTHEETDTDSEGHTTTTTVTDYFGLMGYASMPNSVKSNLIVTSNSRFNQFSKSRLEMESYEFEKLYDVMSADRIYAMKLLKPQIIEEFTKLKESNCKGFEIKFEGNMAYFRYKAGDIFEPPTRGNILSPDKVKEFVMTIYNPIHILLLMNEAISEDYGIVTDVNHVDNNDNNSVENNTDNKKEDETGYFSTNEESK